MDFGASLVHPILHPIDTFNSISDLASGAVQIPMRAGNDWLADRGLAYQRLPEPNETDKRQMDTARAVGGFYKDRYGSMEGFKKTLATDPVGFAADAATILTGGEMAAGRAGLAVAKPLGTAARVANPLTPIVAGAKFAAPLAGPITKGALGLTTGTSADTIGEAYKAARAGGAKKKAFTDNMRGLESQDYVIGEARKALGNISDERRKAYQADMQAIGMDKTQIDFSPIDKVMNDMADSAYYQGHQIASKETMSKLKEIGSKVDEWSRTPTLHTAAGLDALKRTIDEMMPSFTEAGNSERVVTAVRNAIKDQIVSQVPEYAKAMEGFEKSKVAQTEIEKSLSFRRGNSSDETLRKLQSLTRNNANTNYGGRMKSAKILEDAGAPTLMPSLAGQSLSAVVPRGIMQAVAGGAALGGLVNPAVLAALPFASPRLVGEATNAVGTVARKLSRLPKPSRRAAIGLFGLNTVERSERK